MQYQHMKYILIAVLSHCCKQFIYSSGKLPLKMFYSRFVSVAMVKRIYIASTKLVDNTVTCKTEKYSKYDLKNCFAALSISSEDKLRHTLQ